jgi:hypothetical protein
MRGSLNIQGFPPPPPASAGKCGVTSVSLRVMGCGGGRDKRRQGLANTQAKNTTNKQPCLLSVPPFCPPSHLSFAHGKARGIFITDTDRPLRLSFWRLATPNLFGGWAANANFGDDHHEGEPYDHKMVSDARCLVGGLGFRRERCRVKTYRSHQANTESQFQISRERANPL